MIAAPRPLGDGARLTPRMESQLTRLHRKHAEIMQAVGRSHGQGLKGTFLGRFSGGGRVVAGRSGKPLHPRSAVLRGAM